MGVLASVITGVANLKLSEPFRGSKPATTACLCYQELDQSIQIDHLHRRGMDSAYVSRQGTGPCLGC